MTTDRTQTRAARATPMRSAASTGTLNPTIVDAGRWARHYALVVIFLLFGALKFTDDEASGIAPLVMNSPLVMWLHATLGVAGTQKPFATVIGSLRRSTH